MKKRPYREDINVQAEKTTARQISTMLESIKGTNFRKDIVVEMNVPLHLMLECLYR